jgi:hypothetical protein
MMRDIFETYAAVAKLASQINNRSEELAGTKCPGFSADYLCHLLD